jgi:hypothetical protein
MTSNRSDAGLGVADKGFPDSVAQSSRLDARDETKRLETP